LGLGLGGGDLRVDQTFFFWVGGGGTGLLLGSFFWGTGESMTISPWFCCFLVGVIEGFRGGGGFFCWGGVG